MDDLRWYWLGPDSPDAEIARYGAKLRLLDMQRAEARRTFNKKGANALGRQLVAVRRKLLNTLGV